MPQDNRPAVYSEGESVIYRASALGHCLRSLWAARCNMDRRPIPEVIQQGMDEGTNLEPIILDLLYEKHNFTFAYGSQFQLELNIGAWNGKTLIVRGKVDEIGSVADLSRNRPIDVKAFTEDDVAKYRNRGFAAFPRYAWQQSVYDHAYGADGFYMPIFHKGTWEIEPWTLHPLHAPHTLEEIRNRVLSVEEFFYTNTMPEQCDRNFACVYPYLHDDKLTDTLPDGSELLVKARIRLSQREAIFHKARTEIDAKLKKLLPADATYHYDGYTVSVFANPRRFNTDAAKALLTEADIDWENEDEWWIPGTGTQVRFNPPKKAADNG